MGSVPWKRLELAVMCLYALVFYLVVIRRSLPLSHDYSGRLYGLRAGSLAGRLNDLSDPQWRNFRGNLPVLTVVMCAFLILVNTLRYSYILKGRGACLLWLLLSLSYLCYLHGACLLAIFSMAQVLGWPPIRSYRKNTMATNQLKSNKEDADAKQGQGFLYAKVSMDGAPYLRKVYLKTYKNYKDMSLALEKMFIGFSTGKDGV